MTKFQIGDFVRVKTQVMLDNGDKETWLSRRSVGQVLETLVQTCYGGVQTHYVVRLASKNEVSPVTSQFSEPELVAYVPEPPAAEATTQRKA